MKKSLFLFSLLSIVLLSACCQKTKRYGNVIEKWYQPERTYTEMTPVMTSMGRMSSISYYSTVKHDKEKWCVKVKIKTRFEVIKKTYYVDKKTYDTLSIGQYICADDLVSSKK